MVGELGEAEAGMVGREAGPRPRGVAGEAGGRSEAGVGRGRSVVLVHAGLGTQRLSGHHVIMSSLVLPGARRPAAPCQGYHRLRHTEGAKDKETQLCNRS